MTVMIMVREDGDDGEQLWLAMMVTVAGGEYGGDDVGG